MQSRIGQLACAAVAVLVACSCGSARVASLVRGDTPGAAAEILSCVDLPRDDPRSHHLSGLAWDPAEWRLYALSDKDPWITVIEPRRDLGGFEIRGSIGLELDVERWDAEALAIAGDRFLVVANETEPAVFSVDRSGSSATRVAVSMREARHNLGVESLSYVASPQGRYVFVVNEQALEGDGPTSSAARGTVVRIVRHALDGGDDLEVAYLTDPVFAEGASGDNGVSDIAALSPDRLLLLERAYVRGQGNAIRVYEVDLHGAADITGSDDARAAVPVAKRLVVDLALASVGACSVPPQPQRRPALENYEGLALGPRLDDGRPVLFLVSDDNLRPSQVPRIIAVALAPGTW